MYAIYGNICHPYTPNVSIYIYHTRILWVYIYIYNQDLGAHIIGISTTICSFVDAPHSFNGFLPLHLKNFPI